MYISMPRDFFVPVMYDYKENLNLIDEESQEMYRESKGQINAEYQKALQEKEAIYVKPGSKETTGEEKVNEEISKFILEDLERGCTFIHGVGGFSGKDTTLLYAILGRNEFIKLKRFISDVDKYAFITVGEVHEVMGEGFKGIDEE